MSMLVATPAVAAIVPGVTVAGKPATAENWVVTPIVAGKAITVI